MVLPLNPLAFAGKCINIVNGKDRSNHYTCCITPKRVMSLRAPSPRYCVRATQLLPFEEMLQRQRAVGNPVFNLTDPRFEPHTSRSIDNRLATRPRAYLK